MSTPVTGPPVVIPIVFLVTSLLLATADHLVRLLPAIVYLPMLILDSHWRSNLQETWDKYLALFPARKESKLSDGGGEISHISGTSRAALQRPVAGLDRPRPLPPPAQPRRTSQQFPFKKMLTRLSLLSSSFRSNNSRQKPICRICHGDASNSAQPLISPCRCAGSCGAVHKECLETWLSTAKNTKCEICGFEFDVTKEYKPWTKWMCYRPFDRDQRNLTGDLVCFVIFTPLVLVSTYLCGSAVSYYLSLANGRLEAAGLVLLMSFLAFVYSIWLFLTLRFHWDAYRKWKKQTLEIKLNSYPAAKHEERRHTAHETSVFQSPCHV